MNDAVLAPPADPAQPAETARRSGTRILLRHGGIALFIAGWWCFPAGIVHEVWLWALLFPALLFHHRESARQCQPGGTILPAAGWLAALFVLSIAAGHLEGRREYLHALRDIAALLIFLVSTSSAATDHQWMKTARRICVRIAIISAVVSLAVFWGVNGGAHFGERLRNWFVHGGQHPVPTGIAWGFAAVWAATGYVAAQTARRRLRWAIGVGILAFAMCCCQSRGAALASTAGFATLLVAGGWRRAWVPLVIAIGCAATFHGVSTALAWRAEQARTNPKAHLVPSLPPDPGLERLSQDGLRSWINRGDTGRIHLYGIILSRLANPEERLLGKGWLAPDSAAAEVGWPADHPHSIWVATLYHHGQTGAAALAFLMAFFLYRAISVARHHREPEPLTLLCFGITACLFDGQALHAFTTLPRYEALVFWLPVALGNGRWLAPASSPADQNDV